MHAHVRRCDAHGGRRGQNTEDAGRLRGRGRWRWRSCTSRRCERRCLAASNEVDVAHEDVGGSKPRRRRLTDGAAGSQTER
eukprot:6034532-Pleurochrysis_carterae.AAC.2